MKNIQSQIGFTLIEVIIAIAILSIGIFTLLTMQTTSIKGNATSNAISQATAFGADEIEQILSKDFKDSMLLDTDGDDITGLNDSECCNDGNDPSGALVSGCTAKADSCLQKDNYFVYINIAKDKPLTLVTEDSIKTIRVIVNRTDINGVNRTVVFNYFRSRYL